MLLISKHEGFTLLEIIMVLAVGTMILLIGFVQYRHYEVREEITAVKTSVAYLSSAASQYYAKHCQALTSQTLTVKDLQNDGDLADNAVIQNPLAGSGGGDFTVTFNQNGTTNFPQPNSPLYEIQIAANFGDISNDVLAGYQGLLNATSINGNTLIWTTLPNYAADIHTQDGPLSASRRYQTQYEYSTQLYQDLVSQYGQNNVYTQCPQ